LLDGVTQHSADAGDFPYGGWTAPCRTLAGRDAVMAAHDERGYVEDGEAADEVLDPRVRAGDERLRLDSTVRRSPRASHETID